MATNTRSAARQRGGEHDETQSRERTEGAESRLQFASEVSASRGPEGTTPGALTPHPLEAESAEMDFSGEEDELEYYAGLEQRTTPEPP
jgi:hypothetical protein